VVTVALCSWSGWPEHEHSTNCHHDTKEKPESATSVTELLIMGGKTPETCWAVNKRQDNKMESCCIRSVIYLNLKKFTFNNITKKPFFLSLFMWLHKTVGNWRNGLLSQNTARLITCTIECLLWKSLEWMSRDLIGPLKCNSWSRAEYSRKPYLGLLRVWSKFETRCFSLKQNFGIFFFSTYM